MGFLGFGKPHNLSLLDTLLAERKNDEVISHLEEDLVLLEDQLKRAVDKQVQIQRKINELEPFIRAKNGTPEEEQLVAQRTKLREIDLKEANEILDKTRRIKNKVAQLRDKIRQNEVADKELLDTLHQEFAA